MAQRSTNTQAEALSKLIKDIADIKLYPDADLPFLIGLETTVIKYLKEPLERMPGAGGQPGQPAAAGMLAGPAAMGGQMMPGAGPGAGPGRAATRPGRPYGTPGQPGGAPNLDDLRRMIPG